MKPNFATNIVRKTEAKLAERERYEQARNAARKEGAVLRKIKRANKGHEPLWPEDQYGTGVTEPVATITTKHMCQCVLNSKYAKDCISCGGRGIVLRVWRAEEE